MLPAWASLQSLPPEVRVPTPEPAAIIRQVQQVDEVLRVEWRFQEADAENQTALFTGGVVATYGPTTLYADELFVDSLNGRGHARGKVRIVDPEGILEAADLEFDWRAGTGTAREVRAEAYGMRLRIGRVEIGPKEWVGYDVYGTPCNGQPPSIAVSSPRVTLRTGVGGRATTPTFEFYGLKLGPAPTLGFSLDRRIDGFRWPSIGYRREDGVGVSWESGFFVDADDRTAVSGDFQAFQGTLPTFKVQVTNSLLPPTPDSGFLAPQTDLDERFTTGYMDTLYIRKPQREDNYFRQKRRTWSIASEWNRATSARLEDSERISKEWEGIVEQSGPMGPFGYLVQARFQSIRPDGETPFRQRGILAGTVHTGAVPVLPNVDLRLRLDGFGTTGSGREYGWVRALGGVTWEANPQLRLTAAYMHGWDAGTPQFGFDPLYSTSAIHLRADLYLGPLTFNVLAKRDLNQGDWYDHEFGVAWVAGCFEPFIQTRESPRQLQFGIRFRLDQFFNRIEQRNLERR